MRRKEKIKEALKRIKHQVVDNDVFLIIGKNDGLFPYSNSLLIADEITVLIDAGTGDDILNMLKDKVDVLINSHYHIDHILGNRLFGELWVVEEEAGVTESFENYRHYAGIHKTPIEPHWLSWFDDHFKFHPSTPTRTFRHDATFEFGETTLKALHTPGHSPGHCVFYEPRRKILFASDIDLTPFGPWYGNPNAHLPSFIESIKKVMDLKISAIATSHSPLRVKDIEDSLKSYLDIIFKRERIILSLLKKGMTLDELVAQNIIYKAQSKRYKAFEWFERNMLEKHLNMLEGSGRIERVKDKFRAL